jgi:hypothetical protein
VLCDLLLGRDDGLALQRTFEERSRLDQVAFAYMTASKRDMPRLGDRHVLRKPFRISELLEFLQRVVSDHSASRLDNRPPL